MGSPMAPDLWMAPTRKDRAVGVPRRLPNRSHRRRVDRNRAENDGSPQAASFQELSTGSRVWYRSLPT